LAVTVRGAAKPVKVYGVQMRESHYPVAEIGRFQCSDSQLNEFWQISQTTTKLCMEDTFDDCPAYEQTFWVEDSRNGDEMLQSIKTGVATAAPALFYSTNIPVSQRGSRFIYSTIAMPPNDVTYTHQIYHFLYS
jgi:hypothetical protein